MQIKIYVVDYEKYSAILNTTKLKLAKLFGGLSEYPNIKGYWVSPKNELIADNVTVWEIYTDKTTLVHSNVFIEIVKEIRAISAQLSQLYTIDNKTHFV